MKKLLLALLGLAIVAVVIYTAAWSEAPAGTAPSGGTTSQTPPAANGGTTASEIAVPGDALTMTVDYVHDGDTLFVVDGDGERLKVRLIGLDTPEVGEHAECFGEQATARLRELLPEGTRASAIYDAEERDHYDRSLLYLWTPTGTFVNLELVEGGYGSALKVGANDEYWPQLREAETQAQDARLGLWGAC